MKSLVKSSFCILLAYLLRATNGQLFRETRTAFTDLSYSLGPNTIFYPNAQEFQLTREHEDDKRGYWYSSFSFCMGEHGGTHLDAPYHFNKYGWTVDEIPQDRLVSVPATIIDVRETGPKGGKKAVPADYKVQVSDLLGYESESGSISQGSVVLVYTGWSEFWPDKVKYLGFDNSTGSGFTLNFPGFSAAAAQWLIDERNVIGIGIDTPSVDHGRDEDYPVHRYAASRQVYNLENVANLHLLAAKGKSELRTLKLFILPLKIVGGTGSPARILAQTYTY